MEGPYITPNMLFIDLSEVRSIICYINVYYLIIFTAELARKFGLTPEQFGVNLRDNYQRHEVEQDPAEPHELAAEFIKG